MYNMKSELRFLIRRYPIQQEAARIHGEYTVVMMGRGIIIRVDFTGTHQAEERIRDHCKPVNSSSPNMAD